MSRRSHRVLCAAVLLLHIAGCTTWGRQRGASSVQRAGTIIPRARLIMRDGPALELYDVIVRSDSVTGHLTDQERSRMAFARADVVDVQTRELSRNRNMGLGLLAFVVVFTGGFFVWLSQADFGST